MIVQHNNLLQVLERTTPATEVSLPDIGTRLPQKHDESGPRSFQQQNRSSFPCLTSDDLQGWFYCCEHFFIIGETLEFVKLRYVVIHLEGDALNGISPI